MSAQLSFAVYGILNLVGIVYLASGYRTVLEQLKDGYLCDALYLIGVVSCIYVSTSHILSSVEFIAKLGT